MLITTIVFILGAFIIQISSGCRTPTYCECVQNPKKAKSAFESDHRSYYARVDRFLNATIPLVEQKLDLHRIAIESCQLPSTPKDYVYDLVEMLGGHIIPRDLFVPIWEKEEQVDDADACLWILKEGPVFCGTSQRNWALMDENRHMEYFDKYFVEVFKACLNEDC